MKYSFHRINSLAILLMMTQLTFAQNRNERWPVLKSYEGKFLNEVAMPLGGIGTGTVSLGGRGDLGDWEIMNRGALLLNSFALNNYGQIKFRKGQNFKEGETIDFSIIKD